MKHRVNGDLQGQPLTRTQQSIDCQSHCRLWFIFLVLLVLGPLANNVRASAPALHIERAVLLSWEVTPGTYQIETAPRPEGPWALYQGNLFQEDNQWRMVVVAQQDQQYFRLVEAGDPLFPNAPGGADWTCVVDWQPELPPVQADSPLPPDNGSGLVNYTGTYWGLLNTIIDDPTCPSGSPVLQSKFPAGFWGGPKAPGSAPTGGTPIPAGQDYVEVVFDFMLPDTNYGLAFNYLYDFPGAVIDWTATLASRTTSGFTYYFDQPAPAVGQPRIFWVTEWGDQAAARIFSRQIDQPPFGWDPALSTGHIYVAWYSRFSPGFSLCGSNGITNVAQKYLYIHAEPEALGLESGGNAVGIVGYGEEFHPDRLWTAWINQYSDLAHDEHHFWRAGVPEVAADNANDGQWHLHEFLVTPNTIGSTNGQVQVYFDGALKNTVTNLVVFGQWVQRATWCYLAIENYYGGGWARVPADQYQYFGRIRVAVR